MTAPTILVLTVTVVLLVGLSTVAWRYRNGPAAEMFAVLQALSAVWVVLTIVGLRLPPGGARVRLWGLTSAAGLVVALAWFAFIAGYTGRERWLDLRRFGVGATPLVVAAGLYAIAPAWPPLTASLLQRTTEAGTLVRASIGPVGIVVGGYLYLLFLIGLGLLAKTIVEGSELFAGQGIALLVGSSVTIVASLLRIVGVPTGGYPLTQVALGLQSVLLGYAVFGQRFLQVVPGVATIGERAVFDDIDDAVLVVDESGVVTRVNDRAHSYLGAESIVGRSVDWLFQRVGVSGFEELPAQFEYRGRSYQASDSRVRNWREEGIGHAITIRDVTSLVRRRQRLEVLNRILRHNVRNGMTVVVGVASQLRRRRDEDLVEMGETLDRKADAITELSEKAIELDRLFDDPAEISSVALPDLVGDVVSQVRDRYPAATIHATVGPDTIRTDPRILATVLGEVLENAAEHAGEAPEVSLEATRTDTGVRITVSDDGPGIPRTEIGPLVSGTETDLEHASSVGLWIVQWGTQSLGGTVDITAGDDGSTVELSIPDDPVVSRDVRESDREVTETSDTWTGESGA